MGALVAAFFCVRGLVNLSILSIFSLSDWHGRLVAHKSSLVLERWLHCVRHTTWISWKVIDQKSVGKALPDRFSSHLALFSTTEHWRD